MNAEEQIPERGADNGNQEKRAVWFVRFLQAVFLLTALIGLDGPFVSAHNERQNQTYDMARHVFHDGWRAVVTPKASYSWKDHEAERFVVFHQEVPFHGLLGWPFAIIAGHERAVVRLVSVAFALASIQLMYAILRCWLGSAASVAGSAVWATAPLVMHFGQVPMPDILCITGIMAAFFYAMRGRLAFSSGWFLFAILAKASVVCFGLPILAAVLVSKECRSIRDVVRVSILWGWVPLIGLAGWTMLEIFGPPSPTTMLQIVAGRGDLGTLLTRQFYLYSVGCLMVFGLGVAGGLGLVIAALGRKPVMNRWVKWAIIFANGFYLFYVVRKITEPQYYLPLLAWAVVAAAFGFQRLIDWRPAGIPRRSALGVVAGLQVLLTVILVCDLKASRVPNLAEVESAAQLMPADARAVVVYRFYGASATVWLNRNIYAVNHLDELEAELPTLQAAGFKYLLILDIESRHSDFGRAGPGGIGDAIVPGGGGKAGAEQCNIYGRRRFVIAGPTVLRATFLEDV